MYIVIGEIGDLGEGFGRDVIFPEIHSFLRTAIGEEEDAVAMPHRQFIIRIGGGYILESKAAEVEDVDLGVPSAPVAFPVTEHLGLEGKGNLAAIGGQAAELSIGQRESLSRATGGGDAEELVKSFPAGLPS